MQISIEQYVRFRERGYLIVRELLAPAEVQVLLEHIEADFRDRLRVHFLHRELEIHERFLLHPRLVDVVAGLVGPDVLALQTMLFVKGPGSPGQGYHQDSFHIITQPDTLIGAWVALDRADQENGCLWITQGSQHEPVYPDADDSTGHGGDTQLADIFAIDGADNPDETHNGLSAVAAKYHGQEVPVVLNPGDAVFFGGHVLHRSHANQSRTRTRRAFVAHYCNARSYVPWDDQPLAPGEIGNRRHILARGTTHLPHARPRFAPPRAIPAAPARD